MRDYAKLIAGLIANAEDEANSDEARANYRAKAEAMMREYRVSEEEALATEGGSLNVPVLDSITVMERWATSNPLRAEYWRMWGVIAKHCGVRTIGQYEGSRYAEDSSLLGMAVGYAGDIKYAKMLFTTARLVFMTRIDARVDPSLSDEENCYFMRNSGMKRNEIASALWGSAKDDGAAHGKVQRLYLAECVRREETPRVSGRGIQVNVYREAYARGFVNNLSDRLMRARDAADRADGGLVLHGRQERVDEAFYQEFPKQRPATPEEEAAADARAAAYWAEQAELERNCPKCAKAKGKCREHAPSYISAAQSRKLDRQYHGPEAQAGRRAGEAASRIVDLGRTTKPQRAEAGQNRPGIAS
jgi:hypothetical protein